MARSVKKRKSGNKMRGGFILPLSILREVSHKMKQRRVKKQRAKAEIERKLRELEAYKRADKERGKREVKGGALGHLRKRR